LPTYFGSFSTSRERKTDISNSECRIEVEIESAFIESENWIKFAAQEGV